MDTDLLTHYVNIKSKIRGSTHLLYKCDNWRFSSGRCLLWHCWGMIRNKRAESTLFDDNCQFTSLLFSWSESFVSRRERQWGNSFLSRMKQLASSEPYMDDHRDQSGSPFAKQRWTVLVYIRLVEYGWPSGATVHSRESFKRLNLAKFKERLRACYFRVTSITSIKDFKKLRKIRECLFSCNVLSLSFNYIR